MKKDTFFPTISLKLTALILVFSMVQYIVAQKVAIDEARHVAKNLMFEKANLLQNKFVTSSETVNQKDKQVYYYTFNVKNNGGFVIVSGDKRAYPILGYSLHGNSIDGNHSPAFDEWMQMYISQIEFAQSENKTQNKEVANQWEKYQAPFSEFNKLKSTKTIVGPLFGPDGNGSSISWDQSPYYNDSCPGSSVVGCVATAMCQIMVYHDHPNSGVGYREYIHTVANGYKNNYGTLTADFGATTYDAASLPPNISSANASVALISHHAGVSVLMDYDPSGSSSSTRDASHALVVNWNYDKGADYKYKDLHTGVDEWEGMLRAEIDSGMPIIYRGTDDGGAGGHAWVCDGYDDSNDQFHMNWGWDGSDNGFFALTALDPGTYDFIVDQAAIFGIKPNSSDTITLVYEDFEVDDLYLYLSPEWDVDGDGDAHEYGFYINGYDGSAVKIGSAGEIDQWLVSPRIGFPSGHDIELSFYSYRLNNLNQSVVVYISTTGTDIANDFTKLDSITITDSWEYYSVDLTAYAGDMVYLGFKSTGDESSGFTYVYIDDIIVSAISVPELATVTTQPVAIIDTGSAIGNGTITNLGSPNPTAHGVCWSTSGTPTVLDSVTNEGPATSTGPFTSLMTGLRKDTTYYVRAYAINAADTSYGDVVYFTAVDCDLVASTQVDSNVSCYGETDGGATAIPTGGTAPYSFFWSDSSKTATIAGIPADTFYVTITDTNGCSDIDTVAITQPDEIYTSQTVWLCPGDDYTTPGGVMLFNIETYTVDTSVLEASNGCDSTIYTTIELYDEAESTENINICKGDDYTYPDGAISNNITTNESHQSTFAHPVTGCDSIIITNIIVDEVNVAVNINENILSALETNADLYQWIDCDNNNAPITGETSYTFTVTTTGNYAVVIEDDGCVDTSSCNLVTIIGIENINNTVYSIRPNPTTGQIFIDIDEQFLPLEIHITDISGRELQYISNKSESSLELELPGEEGVYFIRMKSDWNTVTYKVIKK